jgi:coenzyme F420-reducing hydrogenase gamma subunit
MPMKRAVFNSIYKVTKSVEDSIERTKEKGSIIVIGVGNCSGIGNDKRAAQLAEDQIKKIETMMKNREKEERKEFRIYTEE